MIKCEDEWPNERMNEWTINRRLLFYCRSRLEPLTVTSHTCYEHLTMHLYEMISESVVGRVAWHSYDVCFVGDTSHGLPLTLVLNSFFSSFKSHDLKHTQHQDKPSILIFFIRPHIVHVPHPSSKKIENICSCIFYCMYYI